MLKTNNTSNTITYFPPSQHLVEKKKLNMRLERIKVLTTLDKFGDIPLFQEKDPMILNDKDLFRRAFTEHPTLADRISHKIPPTILYDEDFMIEMYHLIDSLGTKCFGIFQTIYSEDLLFKLLKIDIRFFAYCRIPEFITQDDRIMQKCLKHYPRLRLFEGIPLHIRDGHRIITNYLKIINSIKTFLLCVINQTCQLRLLRGCSGIISHNICQYLKPISYPTFRVIGSSLFPLSSRVLKSRPQTYDERKLRIDFIRDKGKEIYGLCVV